MKLLIKYTFIALAMLSCTENTQESSNEKLLSVEETLRLKADSLSQAFIIVDGHVDIPYRLSHKPEDISVETKKGHFDFVRAKKGGLNAPFMSIYIPSERENDGAKELADSLIDIVENLQIKHPDKFAVATSPTQIKEQFAKGLISMPMGMENGAPIEGDLTNIQYFYDRGIRYLTLTHAKDNHICDSSYDTTRTWQGLSPFGFEVVKTMNKIGIIVDVSHISDSSFYQVMRISKAPVFASHSSCRHFTTGFERNMSDDMIKVLAKNSGVIQINFGSSFLTDTFRNNKGDEEAFTTVQDVANHIDHVKKLVGIDYVGLGSDFDGVTSLPKGLSDASMIPNLIYELLIRGYTDQEIEKLCYLNTFRVWQAVEDYARNN